MREVRSSEGVSGDGSADGRSGERVNERLAWRRVVRLVRKDPGVWAFNVNPRTADALGWSPKVSKEIREMFGGSKTSDGSYNRACVPIAIATLG